MQKINVTPRLFDSEVLNSSEKRLRILLEANHTKFRSLTVFEQKLGEAEHKQRKAQGKAGKKCYQRPKLSWPRFLAANISKTFLNLQSL